MTRSIQHCLAVWLLTAFSMSAAAQDCRNCACDRCGCPSQCCKVCRLVCELKDAPETCYSCRYEDFCIPARSSKCGEVCECNSCKSATGCGWLDGLLGQHRMRTLWRPSCEAELRTRTKLVKQQVPRKVPTYRWVVEYCCDQCCSTACCQPPIEQRAAAALFEPQAELPKSQAAR